MTGVRGRKPKPTHLKIVGGNAGKRKLNENEPKFAVSLPPPPAFLSKEAMVEWRRVSQDLYTAGLLSKVDRAVLAAYCQAYGRWEQAEKTLSIMAARDELTNGLMIRTTGGNAIQNPIVGIANKAALDMVRYAEQFGMTPSARSRIEAAPPTQEDQIADRFF